MNTENTVNTVKKPKKKKRTAALLVLAGILSAFLILAAVLLQNPRIRLLVSTVRFVAETLNNPSYIAYQVDLMELCREYLNSDTAFEGKVLLDNVRKMKSSINMEVTGERSFAQKKMACGADLSVLMLHIGVFDFYAQDESVSMVVPMLGNLSYSFDTELNLFPKAPELTHDLNADWFRENSQNIVDFTNQIGIRELGSLSDNEPGCKGYEITVPKGSGGFIWDLLGIDPPDQDVVFSIYLTRGCKVRRVVLDLTKYIEDSTLESAMITVDGTNCEKVILDASLPDEETARIVAEKNGRIISSNVIDLSAEYHAATGDVFSAGGYMEWQPLENGFSMILHDLVMERNDETLCSAYFKGALEKTKISEDVFSDVETDLSSIPAILWRDLRDDLDGFFEDVRNEIMRRMKLGSGSSKTNSEN